MKKQSITRAQIEAAKKQFPELAGEIDKATKTGVITALEKLFGIDFEVVEDAPPPPTEPTDPVDVGGEKMEWQDRLNRPQLYFSGPNYFWHRIPVAEVSRILDAIQAAGLDGPSIEFGGDFIADEYNGHKTTRSVRDIYLERIAQWSVWEQGLRRRNLVAHIAFLNSNQSAANKLDDAGWKSLAAAFTAQHGTVCKIILPVSEDDSRTRPSIRKAIIAGLNIPGAQLISHDGKQGHLIEAHHERKRIETGKGHRFLNVTDNATAIADLYGSKWTSGGTPNLANIEDFAARIRQGGTSGAVYSFSTTFDYKGLVAASNGWKGATGTVPSVGMLRSVKADSREFYIRWECDAAVDAWPAKKEGSKSINGWIVVNGVKVEQFQPTYRSQHLKNIYGPSGKGEHGVRGIKTGDTVRIALAAKYSSDETNVVEFVWPWKPT